MNASDLIVEVRNRDLTRVAQLTEADLADLVVVVRSNDVGSWEVTLPDSVLNETTGQWLPHLAAAELRKKGAGIIISGPHGVILSGPMVTSTFEASTSDLSGTWTFSGVSDAVLLADALAYPDPSSANAAAQGKANDKRTSTAEALLRQYVAYNITANQAPAGRVTGLRSRLYLRGSSANRGPTLTKSPRFQNLLELCQEIGFQGGLNFDIAQAGDRLEFYVTEPVDRSKTVRMDLANDLLQSITYGYGSPSTTIALVAGQGEGTARSIISRTNTVASTSETEWGRRIERFIDQRNTDDSAELIQKGDEELLAGAPTATGLQTVPTDTDAMLYARDWQVGDIVTAVVEGQEVGSKVTEAAIGIDGAHVTFVATLGDPATFDTDAAAQNRASSTNSRVSALERTSEVPTSTETTWASITGKPSTFPPSSHSHAWADVTGKPTTFTPASHTHAATDVTSGTFNVARIPNLHANASNGRAYLGTNPTSPIGNDSNFLAISPDSDTGVAPFRFYRNNSTVVAAIENDGEITGNAKMDASRLTKGTLPAARLPSHSHAWSDISGAPIASVGTMNDSDPPSAYPTGVSWGDAGTGFPSTIGTIMTVRSSAFRQFQHFYDRSEPARAYFRTSNGDTSWRAWREFLTDASMPKTLHGTDSYAGSLNGTATVGITFPSGTFTSPPTVVVSPKRASALGGSPVVEVMTVTATSAQIQVRTTASVVSPSFTWIATGS